MICFKSKKKGLTIWFKKESKRFDQFGNTTISPGEKIVFDDGFFYTNEEEKIRFLDSYMKQTQEIKKIDMAEIQKIEELRRETLKKSAPTTDFTPMNPNLPRIQRKPLKIKADDV